MPRGKDFKRLIRSRMRKTGESYTTARARLSGARRRRPASNRGGLWMYPFERFSERTKRVLTFAQQEAEGAGVNYIGTEHLLLGLFHESDGIAAQALANLGIDNLQVRETIERLVGEVRRGDGAQIVPTSRTRRVIELAFEVARGMGDPVVGTEHLLIAILVEGDGIGARVLFELGVTMEAARAEVRRLRQDAPPPERAFAVEPLPAPDPRMGHGPELAKLLATAQRLARQEDSRIVLLQHLMLAMTEEDRTASILGRLGVDVPGMRVRLTPPGELASLREAHRQLRMRRQEAVAQQRYEVAADIRDQEQEAMTRYGRANQAWLESWGGGGEPPSP